MKQLSLAVVLLLLLGTMASGAEPIKTTFRATVGEDGVQHVAVLGGGYFFDPQHIIVKVNVPVSMAVRKEAGMVPHNLVITAPEAGINVNADLVTEPKTIKFTPTRTGTYPIYCDKKLLFFASHREKGMEGILEVVE